MYEHGPDPLSITQRRKSVDLSPKSYSWTSKQLFAIHFLLATCNVCPLAIPKFFAHNMGIRLLANHSFKFWKQVNRQNKETRKLTEKLALELNSLGTGSLESSYFTWIVIILWLYNFLLIKRFLPGNSYETSRNTWKATLVDFKLNLLYQALLIRLSLACWTTTLEFGPISIQQRKKTIMSWHRITVN